jgi:flagellar hook assembly protein FlgD
MQMGAHEIDWNGLDNLGQNLAPGNYTYVVHASSEDGKAIPVKSSYLVKVTGVGDILGGGKLETTAGPIDPAKVLAIRTHDQQKTEKKTLTTLAGDTQNGIHQ